MTMNFGNQNAGRDINNIIGNLHRTGDGRGSQVSQADALRAAAELHAAVAAAPLSRADEKKAAAALREIDAGTAAGESGRGRVGRAVERLAASLHDAGALAGAAANLAAPLAALTAWAGTAS